MNQSGYDNYSDRRAPMKTGRSGAQNTNRSGAQSYAQSGTRDADRYGAQRTARGGQRRNPASGAYPRNTAGTGQTRSASANQGASRAASANQGVRGASASGTGASTSLQSGRRAPVRVRRAADVTRRGGAMTANEQRSLAKREKKEKEWESGIQRVRHGVDRPLTVIIIILLCLGTIMVFSASSPTPIT